MTAWISGVLQNLADMASAVLSAIWEIPLAIVAVVASTLGQAGPWSEGFQAASDLVGSGYLRWVDLVVPVEFAAQCFANYIMLWIGIKSFVGLIRWIKGWV